MIIFLHPTHSRASTGDAYWRSGVRRPRVRPRQPGSREASGRRPPTTGRCLRWLDEGRTNGAKAPGSGGRRVRRPTPEARSRGPKSRGEAPKGAPARVMGRRSLPLEGPARPQGGPRVRRSAPAPVGASPPRLSGGDGKDGARAPVNSPAAMEHVCMTTESMMTDAARSLFPSPRRGGWREQSRAGRVAFHPSRRPAPLASPPAQDEDRVATVLRLPRGSSAVYSDALQTTRISPCPT